MSWPIRYECPTCFKLVGYPARRMSERLRCICDETAALTEVHGDPLLQKSKRAA